MLNKIFLLFYLASLFSCGFDAHYQTLNGGYFLSAIDTREDMSLGFLEGAFGVGVVNPTVFAVGQNEDYIVLKQHPTSLMITDKSITNYWIVPPAVLSIKQLLKLESCLKFVTSNYY